MRVGLLTLATTAHALRPSLMLLPGASTGRITEDEARKRTSWPHWKRESDWTADEEEAAVAPPSPTKPQKAYTLAYFQDRVKARARKDALLGLVAASAADSISSFAKSQLAGTGELLVDPFGTEDVIDLAQRAIEKQDAEIAQRSGVPKPPIKEITRA